MTFPSMNYEETVVEALTISYSPVFDARYQNFLCTSPPSSYSWLG
jgi:hypothetical protein